MAESSGQDYEDEFLEPSSSEEINALGKGGCYWCGGFGHIARECPTPEGKSKGKGKPKGKSTGKGWNEGK